MSSRTEQVQAAGVARVFPTSGKTKLAVPEVHVLTVPHSGTRHVATALKHAKLPVAWPDKHLHGERIHVCHWHATDRYAPVRIGILRDPIATLVTHTRSADKTPAYNRTVDDRWNDLLNNVWVCWGRLLHYADSTAFFAVEELPAHKEAFESILRTALGVEVVLDFENTQRHTFGEYPLKDALRNRDAEAIKAAVPPRAWDMFGELMPAPLKELYRRYYDLWWMA